MGLVSEFGGFVVAEGRDVSRTLAVNLPTGFTIGHVGLAASSPGRSIAGIVEFTRANGQVVSFGVPVGWETAMYAEAKRAVVGAYVNVAGAPAITKAWFFFQRWV